MATLSSFIALPKNPKTHFLSDFSEVVHYIKFATFIYNSGDGGRSISGSIFVGGFVLGGLIVGALGCIYAPQISMAIAGADRKDLMRKLPKFVYDEDKALEKTRKVLTEKIAQLNSAIDGVSAQLRSDVSPNEDPDELAVNSEEMEASVQ
ncbi:uncharacterized protein HKW66_Vig0155440 [Vigna angularis]|uniref:Uncharacterized protein n=1 Tax=Phaseolus angularis TaxID=3914 RepID=A0A8T0JMZ4_PHAAN|nr:uncharacterized protein HKW66_Vig0155440 [Vigna angularis]